MSLLDLLNGMQSAPAAAPAAPIETAARAAAVASASKSAGSPEADLAALLAAFEANATSVPKVNPPEAAKVLATATKAEVAGTPEPEAADEGPVVELPTSKPAEVLAAEAAGKTRRTAAVVQVELDATNDLLKQAQLGLVEQADTIQQLRDEAKMAAEDLTKAHARAEEMQGVLDKQASMLTQAAVAITALQSRAGAALQLADTKRPLSDYGTQELARAINAQGWIVRLEVAPS